MVTVQAFSIPGIKMWFPANDHEPEHFHAEKKGEWQVRVFFMESESRMIVVKENQKRNKEIPSRRIRKLIVSNVLKHRAELLEEWEKVPRT